MFWAVATMATPRFTNDNHFQIIEVDGGLGGLKILGGGGGEKTNSGLGAGEELVPDPEFPV
jgi:hypothetical protein